MQQVARSITLRDGITIPTVGLGVWKAKGNEAVQAVRWALETGYRLIDTATIYENETEVGTAIRESGIPREEIFLTTKLWNQDQGFASALAAIDRSLQRLGTDYVDLYLIHWPFMDYLEGENRREETWRAMEKILACGKARSIGVSNYTIEHLEEMERYALVPPAVNQIEFHPFYVRRDLMEYCHAHQIALEDYSPLSRGKWLLNERITAIARSHDKSNAQVLLRWALQHGNIVIPKSVHKERIEENIRLFDFSLSPQEMDALDGLNQNESIIFGKL